MQSLRSQYHFNVQFIFRRASDAIVLHVTLFLPFGGTEFEDKRVDSDGIRYRTSAVTLHTGGSPREWLSRDRAVLFQRHSILGDCCEACVSRES